MRELGHTDLVEEILIEDFSEAQIIKWLRTNSHNAAYSLLMDKYEPIWSKQSAKLKLAVASFGQSISALKKIYDQEDDYLIKSAVLRNPNFGHAIGISFGLRDEEIKKLYKTRKPFFGLFEQLFCNPKISPKFIADLFSTTYYKEIKQKDLATILPYLTQYIREEDGKVPLDDWVEQADTKDECKRAIDALVMFIAKFNFKPCKGEIFSILFDFDNCLRLLPDFRFFMFNEGQQAAVLRKFNPESFPKKVLKDPYADMERSILSIQRWFAKNFFKHSAPGYLYSEFKSSKIVRERLFYYQNSSLSDMFSVEYFRVEYLPLIEDIIWSDDAEESALAHIVPSKGLGKNEDGWSSKKHLIAYEAFEKHLLLDKHVFVGALACNENLFKSKEYRNWLQKLCQEADSYFSLFPADLFFGTGTCLEVFDAKLAQLQKLYPEEFTDLTEAGKLSDIKADLIELKAMNSGVVDLTNEVQQVKTSLAKASKNQEEFAASTNHRLNQIQEKLGQTSNRLENIWHMKDEPTDLISRFVFKIPIIGNISKKS